MGHRYRQLTQEERYQISALLGRGRMTGFAKFQKAMLEAAQHHMKPLLDDHRTELIAKSLEALDDIAFYIRRFPFKATRITPERYLQFHVEAHYSEIYILKDRLTNYITLFQRQFNGSSTAVETRRTLTECRAALQRADKCHYNSADRGRRTSRSPHTRIAVH